MKPLRTAALAILSAAALIAAAAAATGALMPAQAQGAAATPAPCTCSAGIEITTSTLPTSPRAWITHCQCGAQSCAVLNTNVLQCSR